jgi:biopolymer transport protein ExbB/TolQ
MDALIQGFVSGGIFMWPILAVGIFVIAIMVERSMALYKNYKMTPADLRNKLMSYIALGQFNEAKSFVQMTAPGTSLGKVIEAGLSVRQLGGGDEEVQARMDEALSNEIGSIDRRTGFLAVYGNVATL